MKSWSALSESVIGLFGIHIISQYTDYDCLTVQDNFFMQRENISVKEFSMKTYWNLERYNRIKLSQFCSPLSIARNQIKE